MHAKLINEVKLSFQLETNGPLLINNPPGSKIDPTLPDMSFVRCDYKGQETVYLPGSSLKGVFRARYEQLFKAVGKPVCKLFDRKENCEAKIKEVTKKDSKGNDNNNKNRKKLGSAGKERYRYSCAACRLFGSLAVGSRIDFSDAYPMKGSTPVLGMRHGVGINRITGAAHPGALFDIEVVESGVFQIEMRLKNFAIYQLRAVLWILEDIDEGMVTFGMGGSRGNGQMRIHKKEEMQIKYRLYDQSDERDLIRGYEKDDIGGKIVLENGTFGKETKIIGMENILNVIGIKDADDLKKAMGVEEWDCIILHRQDKLDHAAQGKR